MPTIARPLARRSCASDPPPVVLVDRWSFPRCRCLPVVLRVHLPAGLALDARCRRLRVILLFVGRWFCPRCSMPTIARPLARRSCASSGFPYCQKAALDLQALAREPPLVVPTKRRACVWLELATWSLWSLWSLWSSLPTPRRSQVGIMSEGARRWTPDHCKPTATKTRECARMRSQDALGRVFWQK